MAMNIIYKDKKDINWIGFPTNSAQELISLQVSDRQSVRGVSYYISRASWFGPCGVVIKHRAVVVSPFVNQLRWPLSVLCFTSKRHMPLLIIQTNTLSYGSPTAILHTWHAAVAFVKGRKEKACSKNRTKVRSTARTNTSGTFLCVPRFFYEQLLQVVWHCATIKLIFYMDAIFCLLSFSLKCKFIRWFYWLYLF